MRCSRSSLAERLAQTLPLGRRLFRRRFPELKGELLRGPRLQSQTSILYNYKLLAATQMLLHWYSPAAVFTGAACAGLEDIASSSSEDARTSLQAMIPVELGIACKARVQRGSFIAEN